MAMISMKQSAEEAKEECAVSCEPREYPYGLEIRLDEESLSKLGLTAPPAVGSEMVITAKVVVTSASQYQTQGQEAESSSCWQITDMEVSGSQTRSTAAQSLYGS